MCGGVDAGGGAELHSMQSPIHNASEYVEELWRCIGDALEMHWKSMEFNMQGCTLTHTHISTQNRGINPPH